MFLSLTSSTALLFGVHFINLLGSKWLPTLGFTSFNKILLPFPDPLKTRSLGASSRNIAVFSFAQALIRDRNSIRRNDQITIDCHSVSQLKIRLTRVVSDMIGPHTKSSICARLSRPIQQDLHKLVSCRPPICLIRRIDQNRILATRPLYRFLLMILVEGSEKRASSA